jgi:dTDP-4-amino-4,6-dideoxygalactose transaminase
MSDVRQVPFARPWITDEDRKAVMEVLEGHVLTHGPQGKAFEAEFAAYMGPDAHCVSVSSCMAALHLAYLHFGFGPGDEVIVPAQTHSATAHAVEWVGATPVFVDCDPATGNVTAALIEPALTPRTKAISVVHFDGIPCDMPAIAALAARRGLKLVEDCALAVGGRWDGRHVGLFGDVGTFSFYPVKHITTAEGGMFVSRHHDVAEAVGRLRAFGVDRTHTERAVPGMYDVPTLGLHYRMSEIQAALGRTQLRRMDTNLALREAHFRALQKALASRRDVRVIDAVDPRAQNSFYCLTVVFEGTLGARRHDIVARLNAAGVGTSVYYPQPVPRMTYYRKKYGYEPERFTQAAEISDQSVALPVGPHLSDTDVQYVAKTLTTILEELGG